MKKIMTTTIISTLIFSALISLYIPNRTGKSSSHDLTIPIIPRNPHAW